MYFKAFKQSLQTLLLNDKLCQMMRQLSFTYLPDQACGQTTESNQSPTEVNKSNEMLIVYQSIYHLLTSITATDNSCKWSTKNLWWWQKLDHPQWKWNKYSNFSLDFHRNHSPLSSCVSNPLEKISFLLYGIWLLLFCYFNKHPNKHPNKLRLCKRNLQERHLYVY